MKGSRYILALCAFFAVALATAGCGSGVPGNSVAVVAGNPITTQAFNHWMYVAAKGLATQSPGQPVIVPTDPPQFDRCIANVRAEIPSLAKSSASELRSDCSQLFTSLSSQVMQFLITAYWYQAEAARQHVKVSNSEIQSAFNAAKQQQFPTDTAFQTFLTQTGQTLEDILYRFRINQIFTKLAAKHASTISNAQIRSYYYSHLSQFGTPATRNIRIVLTKSRSQADAAKAALSSGQSWSAVAKQYSTDPTKNSGGLLRGVSKTSGTGDATFDTAAFTAPLNQVLGPVQGQYGFYVYEVTSATKGNQQTLAQATPLIRETLSTQQQTSAQTAVENQAKKDWLGQTSCRKEYAVADCSGYKAPKSSTTSSTPTTG